MEISHKVYVSVSKGDGVETGTDAGRLMTAGEGGIKYRKVPFHRPLGGAGAKQHRRTLCSISLDTLKLDMRR